jgi:coenzyme F420-reducing hydrogenase alpha subunit
LLRAVSAESTLAEELERLLELVFIAERAASILEEELDRLRLDV